MRYFIELSYNGKNYHGWQNQPNAISVQEGLEKALSTLLKTKISIVGAGRTDTGVHAIQMFAHFDATFDISLNQLVFKLNSFLPKDISVHNIFNVQKNGHARFDALSRTYLYRISTRKNVFNFNEAYFFKNELDIDQMNKACEILFEYSNFKCFSRSNTDVKTYNCKIKFARWEMVNGELKLTITADRFLRNMVRAIVGTMLEIGTGKLNIEMLHTIIKSEDRSEAGASVPAHGLYLMKIDYPKHLFL